MRFFHIADLHLGKYLKDKNLIEDQRDWVEKFLAECGIGEAGEGKDKPDAVVIAGDVFDEQNPPADARKLLEHLITELSNNGIAVLMIAGNHDIGGSTDRAKEFEIYQELLATRNVHVAAVTNKVIKHVHIGDICFWLLPYTDRLRIADVMGVDSYVDDTEAVKALIDAQDIDHSICNVILSHQNVVLNGKSVETSGSESISTGNRIGGIGPLESYVFNGFDYVALGHIHSGMPVGEKDSVIKYAGTPLCYHLDETKFKNNKGYIEVVIDGKTVISKSHKHIEPLHNMEYPVCKEDDNLLDAIDYVPAGSYVGIKFEGEVPSDEIIKSARSLLEERDCIWLGITRPKIDRQNTGAATSVNAIENADNISDTFIEFYKLQNKGKGPSPEVLQLLKFIDELKPEDIPAVALSYDRGNNPKYEREYAEKIIDKLMKIVGG